MKLGFFTAAQVCVLCGISERQLTYWNRTGFFRPQFLDERKRAFNRVYSFRDVVGLRTIGLLRNEHHAPLHDLRNVDARLNETPDAHWSKLRFYVGSDHRVYLEDPRSGELIATRPLGQRPLTIVKMNEIARGVERAIATLRKRSAREFGQVLRNRHIAENLPVLAGTRIPTAAVWEYVRAGYDTSKIIREFPRLTPADVAAAIQFEEQRQSDRAAK